MNKFWCGFSFAKLLRKKMKTFDFVALHFCVKKKHFAQLFANFISRKIALFCFCVILFRAFLRNKFAVKG